MNLYKYFAPGFICGICTEYMIRVKFSVYPLIIILLLTLAVIVARIADEKEKNL